MTGLRGALVVNKFLRGNKYSQIYSLLLEAFKRAGIDMTIIANDDSGLCIGERLLSAAYDFILFWDKDIILAKRLEREGHRLFNRADAIEACDDKRLTAVMLENNGIRMPKTVIAPFTFANVGYTDTDFLTKVADTLGFPLILKEARGSFGEQVYFVKDFAELKLLTESKADKGLIYQQFVSSSAGRDVRVQVIGGEITASVIRHGKEGDFRSNVTGGGRMSPYSPDKDFTDTALKACAVLGVDYAGVDMLFGRDGEAVLCEVNASAHFKNLLDATGVNAAVILAEYVRGEMTR